MELYWNDTLASREPGPQEVEAFLTRLERENCSLLELRRGPGSSLAAGRLLGAGCMMIHSSGGFAEIYWLSEPKLGRTAGLFQDFLGGKTPRLVPEDEQECACPTCAMLKARREGPAAPGAAHKLGRNEPCPCGSGRKFKRCCAR